MDRNRAQSMQIFDSLDSPSLLHKLMPTTEADLVAGGAAAGEDLAGHRVVHDRVAVHGVRVVAAGPHGARGAHAAAGVVPVHLLAGARLCSRHVPVGARCQQWAYG